MVILVVMARTSFSQFTGRDLFLACTMMAIIVLVLVFGNKSTYLRSKAYVQTASGIRIETEEMSLSGAVSKDPSGTFVQF